MGRIIYYKIKNSKSTKIKKPKSINKFLDKGYTITKVTSNKNETKIKIKSYSPMTRSQAYKKSLKHKLMKR